MLLWSANDLIYLQQTENINFYPYKNIIPETRH